MEGGHRKNWYDRFSFKETERNSIDEAKRNIQNAPAEITRGRVVAELTFAFWVRLAAFQYQETLWLKCLHRIFPIKLQRKQIHDRLINLKTLRNRIAHHERIIYKRNPEQDYGDLLETAGWLCPEMKAWIEHTNCFPERFAKRLAKPPKQEFQTDPLPPGSTS